MTMLTMVTKATRSGGHPSWKFTQRSTSSPQRFSHCFVCELYLERRPTQSNRAISLHFRVLIYRDLCSCAGLDVFDRRAVLAKKPSNPLLVYSHLSVDGVSFAATHSRSIGGLGCHGSSSDLLQSCIHTVPCTVDLVYHALQHNSAVAQTAGGLVNQDLSTCLLFNLLHNTTFLTQQISNAALLDLDSFLCNLAFSGSFCSFDGEFDGLLCICNLLRQTKQLDNAVAKTFGLLVNKDLAATCLFDVGNSCTTFAQQVPNVSLLRTDLDLYVLLAIVTSGKGFQQARAVHPIAISGT
eukprot:s122_g24.t2